MAKNRRERGGTERVEEREDEVSSSESVSPSE